MTLSRAFRIAATRIVALLPVLLLAAGCSEDEPPQAPPAGVDTYDFVVRNETHVDLDAWWSEPVGYKSAGAVPARGETPFESVAGETYLLVFSRAGEPPEDALYGVNYGFYSTETRYYDLEWPPK